MKEIKARLTQRIQRSENIISFRFMPPEKIEFRPGQFLQFIFDGQNRENKDLNKYLSLSSSPTKDYIEVTKRVSTSQFCKHLMDLRTDDEVLLKLPMGSCVFRDDYRKIGFLVGGIGITPVISIVEYIMEKKLDTDVCLFYSNRIDTDIAFRTEFDIWQMENPALKIFYTVTECEPTDNTCLFGFIDENLVMRNIQDLDERIIFIFGPPKMVESMCSLSVNLNCKNENIKIEQFTGY